MGKNTGHLLLHSFNNGELGFGVAFNVRHWQPRVDVYRTAKALLVAVELAGVAAEGLRLHFEPGLLTIEGQRQLQSCGCEAQCLQMEITRGEFHRELPLPPEADGENISARSENGLLWINVPLKPPEEPRSLRVSIR